MKSVRAAYVVTLSMIVLAVSAAPAAAATPVLASDKYKWFYWLGILVAVGLVLWLLMTVVMYYFRVLRPKYRGRKVS